MAYQLTSADGHYLEVVVSKSGVLPAAYPITIACWFKITSGVGTANHSLAMVSNSGGTNRLLLMVASSGELYGMATTASANSSAVGGTVSADTWHHGAAVFTNSTSRQIYLDGAAGTPASGTRAIATYDRISIGRRILSEAYLDGHVAEVGFWNVALTAAEINSLAKGLTPLSVRPNALFHYSPLVRSLHELTEGEKVTAYESATATGYATPSPHPRIYKK